MKVDIKLQLTDQNYFDIDFDPQGDFVMTEGLDTALTMSIFCEKRANSSEIPTPELQRGWWGNLFNDVVNYEQGSKLWLLYQARKTQEVLNRGVAYVQDGFNWLVEDNFADKVTVSGDFTSQGMQFNVKIFRSQNPVGSYAYGLWQGTGQ